jgi:hypothetical protein
MKTNKNNSNNPTVVPAPAVVRCAISARCATDVPTEDPNSLPEQIRTCTEYALKRGWEVTREFVQSDIRSGVSPKECTFLLQLLEAAQREHRPFDCVLIADMSRLGRNLGRVITLVNTFHGRGVFIQSVHGQFDSRNLHPGVWATKHFLNCVPQYLKPTALQCPVCGR